jgi:hypothetical protein
MAATTPTRVPIGYIAPEPPPVEVPPYTGTRYEALVPDTLDLQERAALAVNGLTGPTDPEADHELYWLVSLGGQPFWMGHDNNDVVQTKFMEALPLMRLISGNGAGAEVERRWMEVVPRMQGPDGLLYWPVAGRPWAFVNAFYAMPEGADHYTAHHMVGRLLGAISLFYPRSRDERWRQVGEGVVRGLDGLARKEGDAASFASVYYGRGGVVPAGQGTPTPYEHAHAAWAIQGLAQFYRATGHAPALTLAGQLARYLHRRSGFFAPDGSFLPDEPPRPRAHFHMHTLALLALTEYALLVDDRALLDFVQGGYAFAKAHGTPLVGHFPEWLNTTDLETSETCQVADMIALGVKLSAAGLADYWEDVDRWTRNQFAENQLRRTGWLTGPTAARDLTQTRIADHAVFQTTERVAERNLGAFAGWPDVNDWYIGRGPGIMHCCTGNGTRAIYYVWQEILTHAAGRLRLNLLLNRASPWADVDSHLPYTGQVDLRVKQPVDLAVRLPEWVALDAVTVTVDGRYRPVGWQGRHAQIGPVAPGATVTVAFPIAERLETIQVEKRRFSVILKGNEVVAIDPPGRYCPLYQRDHYRESGTRWRVIERFVTDEAIRW